MMTHFKITRDMLNDIRIDLAKAHVFAAERVGFISCRVGALHPEGTVALAHDYLPVANDDYLPDSTVGAMMGPGAIRKAMQYAYNTQSAMFHVHMHHHTGIPWFSRIDLLSASKFVPDFWNVRPEMPHGALVLSLDSAAGLCWHPSNRAATRISRITVVGAPIVNINEG